MSKQNPDTEKFDSKPSRFPKRIRTGWALFWAAVLSAFGGVGGLWIAPYLNPQPKLFVYAQVFEEPYALEAGRKGYGPEVVLKNAGSVSFENIEILLVFTRKGASELEIHGYTTFHNAKLLEARIEENWLSMHHDYFEYKLTMKSLNPGESFSRKFNLNQPTIVTVEVIAKDFFYKQNFE